jgi:hypothetical protein
MLKILHSIKFFFRWLFIREPRKWEEEDYYEHGI